jgi:D-3-phosphoglycerate dehydrogenase
MSSERVLIGSRSFGKTFPEHLERLRAAGCEVIPNQLGRAYREAELFDALDGVSCIVTGTDELTRAAIDGAGSLRVIAKHGVGVENIDVDAAQERGIVVLATPGAMSESVAELAFALMLALARSIVPAHLETRAGGWRLLPGHELRGKTLGLVGFGRIAQEVAIRARAFGMTVVAHDPFGDARLAAEQSVELLSLDAVLERADVVSLHAALPAGGGPLIGSRELSLLRPSATLVNTARGALVDESALADALAGGRLAGAALDVFVEEPPVGSPLLGLENVVLTPHLGGQTTEALHRMGEQTVANCLEGLGLA